VTPKIDWRGDVSQGTAFLRIGGGIGIALGVVMLLFVGHQLFITDIVAGMRQQEATATLMERWRDGPTAPVPVSVSEGDGTARLYAPSLGREFAYTVLEGTTEDTLAAGPGHYSDTAHPGEPGNFAVAGHHVTNGAPFRDIGSLGSCDPLVVETSSEWLVYRVLPLADEVSGWADGKGAQERCRGVAPLPPPYDAVPGAQVVPPSAVQVVAPVPGARDVEVAPAERARLITLTTCYPAFSARERLVVHGVLVARRPHSAASPSELAEGTSR